MVDRETVTNPMDLTGKMVMVTGASSGIGRATALLCSALGASVVLVGRDRTRLAETSDQMTGGDHVSFSVDLSDLDNLERNLFVQLDGRKLSGLVHAAGIGQSIPVQSISLKRMTETMTINFYSFLELVRCFSKKKYSDGGSIVGISSISALAGWSGVSLYSGSKGAVDSAIRSLAIELASKCIRVNSVVPSNIRTPMFERTVGAFGKSAIDTVESRQPLGLGDPGDIANAVAFLLSDAARFITGTQMVVDGGYLAQ